MQRTYHRWHSPALGRDMEMLVFGHAGARLLAFPTCAGRFSDWEDQGMIAVVADQIARGDLQVYCVDSLDNDCWFAEHLHPAERARRHASYDAYLREEVFPLTRHNANPFLITAGTSFGAYHALNFAFRYPDWVGRTLSLSGLWDLKWLAQGWYDAALYYHNPVDYLANEHDSARLAALRRQDIILAVGSGEYVLPVAEQLSGLLWQKGIGNALRVWQGVTHDWFWWRQMLGRYLGGHD